MHFVVFERTLDLLTFTSLIVISLKLKFQMMMTFDQILMGLSATQNEMVNLVPPYPLYAPHD